MGHSTTVHTGSNFDSILVNFLDTLGCPHDGCSCRCPIYVSTSQIIYTHICVGTMEVKAKQHSYRIKPQTAC